MTQQPPDLTPRDRQPQQDQSARRICVIGGGPAAFRFVTTLLSHTTPSDQYNISVFMDEPYLPYDRVQLSKHITSDAQLSFAEKDFWEQSGVSLYIHTRIVTINAQVNTIITADGKIFSYDELVIATGSTGRIPAIPGAQYGSALRTLGDVYNVKKMIADLQAVSDNRVSIAVIGGGILGVEAAYELRALGVHVSLIHSRKWLMHTQLDQAAGNIITNYIRHQDIDVYLGHRPDRILPCSQSYNTEESITSDDIAIDTPAHPSKVATARYEIVLGDGTPNDTNDLTQSNHTRIAADIIIFSTGIIPRDELAQGTPIATDPHGGIIIDDHCRTSWPHIWAIGEVTSFHDIRIGSVAPANAMAETAAHNIAGNDTIFTYVDESITLNLHQMSVASFGDSLGITNQSLSVVYADPIANIYQKIVLGDDAKTLLGGIFLGDTSAVALLRPFLSQHIPHDPSAYFIVNQSTDTVQMELPDAAQLCSCNNVSVGTVRAAIRGEQGFPECHDIPSLKKCTRAGTQCGSCVPLMKKILDAELIKMGISVSAALCEHVQLSREQLFEAVAVLGYTRASEIMNHFVTGLGCDICKPVIASILASQTNSYILDSDVGPFQDTNDRALANLQKDGSYSVVPRIPAGEITPAKLKIIAEIAEKYQLYTKITGAQRIDMFGARLEQLPLIWQELVAAGFESGQAYGKSMRTVKSCVGTTWCRYGVQDSVTMAIDMENRYKGIRSPHKLKMGVSGCARECAEARSKDIGVIATEKGWNLYVGGNGGFQPAHGVLLASNIDTETLITYIDRYIMYYIRSADRLERTARWQERISGGLDHIREVVCEDSLGIGQVLEQAIELHRSTYKDEWAETLANPRHVQRFRSFVNAPTHPDPSIVRTMERDQPIPG